jgi:hypothetical protein
LASLENQWRYASYEKIRDGSAPNHPIRWKATPSEHPEHRW